jgi:hypothetical protein
MLLATVGVVGAGVLGPTALGDAGAPRPDRFVELRVCGATAFSRSLGRCSKDERRTPITSNRISCSARLRASQSGVWRFRFSYNGAADPWIPADRFAKGDDGVVSAYTNIRTSQPLPGGNWTCEFAFRSARAAVSFKSGGPVGKIVSTTVCPESDVLTYGRDAKTCATDHASKPLPLSEPVYCTAVFAGVRGQSAQIQFLQDDGSPVWVWNFDIPWPVYQNYAFTSSIKVEGDYLCRFKLGDGTTVDKPFRVGAG